MSGICKGTVCGTEMEKSPVLTVRTGQGIVLEADKVGGQNILLMGMSGWPVIELWGKMELLYTRKRQSIFSVETSVAEPVHF